MTKTLEIKLASIAVHVEEMMSANSYDFAVQGPAVFDKMAIEGLLSDQEVRAYLDDPSNTVYLPLKRSARKVVTKKKR